MDAVSLPERGFDELPTEVAILDGDGDVVYTNRAWRTFATANGYREDPSFSGVNYLAACDRAAADCDEAGVAARGIRNVLAGTSDLFTMEYDCHSPTDRRWFLMRAVPFESPTNARHALVMHLNVTDRRLAEERVKAQNDRLEMLAYVLSTDLEAPLSAAVETVREIAERDEATARKLARALGRIEAVVETGTALADADATLDQRPTLLRERATEAWARVNEENALFLVVNSRALYADPNLFQLLFEVLFANAVEHGGDTVRVRVGTTRDGFYVEDDGPGIDPEHRERVFESGTVLDRTLGSRGMGLTVAARVADLHGWTIRLDRSPVGGARFEVEGVEWV